MTLVMNRRLFGSILTLGGLAFATSAFATPLRLDYSVSGGPTFTYNFTLTLDNHDATWASGNGFGWLVFGDVPTGSSNLTSWIGNTSSFVGGPWNSFGTT